ncbi:acylphosphatase [Hankyongella ginsenosidimutans]|uniref:Acylphosphatase n=1 Tax=Hankyongella ginsenosidimutans TaxID=1763828 RepID=A0A4D7C2M8_9SPHN|nr:acylphosphatase [Hankyongella ginsenosidimutans]QCI79321.1 acylphosphatase [Hankyongella ginsenosidimutans]TXG82807.1 MAG: acylphosphatase [Sphingomonadales bacterium]
MNSSEADLVAHRLVITGKVQGVGFRDWTVRSARRLGLNGWVRNRLDGSVEALVIGPAGDVELLLASVRRGPPLARVDAVTIEPARGVAPDGFTRKPTV